MRSLDEAIYIGYDRNWKVSVRGDFRDQVDVARREGYRVRQVMARTKACWDLSRRS